MLTFSAVHSDIFGGSRLVILTNIAVDPNNAVASSFGKVLLAGRSAQKRSILTFSAVEVVGYSDIAC
jgi:hypothetical protein